MDATEALEYEMKRMLLTDKAIEGIKKIAGDLKERAPIKVSYYYCLFLLVQRMKEGFTGFSVDERGVLMMIKS